MVKLLSKLVCSFFRYGALHESGKEESLDNTSYFSKVHAFASIRRICMYYHQHDCVSHWVVIMMIGAAQS